MKATLDCLECVIGQALRAARVATNDLATQRRILDEVAKRLPLLDINRSPASISLCAYELAARLSGNPDPYRNLRCAQNELALRLEPELRRVVADARRGDGDDPLKAALHLSAAGNVIDLGVMQSEEIDIKGAITQVLNDSFAVEHLAEFRASLSRCKDLLFFLDNAGEIVFDKILIEELLHHTRVTAVVKAAPIINDAVMEDAEQVGLTSLCEVIDCGGAYVGAPLDLIPASFRARLDQADVVVGKGQGNYETLDDYPGDVFLILRAKCHVVAQHMGVRHGQVGLISTRARRAARPQP